MHVRAHVNMHVQMHRYTYCVCRCVEESGRNNREEIIFKRISPLTTTPPPLTLLVAVKAPSARCQPNGGGELSLHAPKSGADSPFSD